MQARYAIALALLLGILAACSPAGGATPTLLPAESPVEPQRSEGDASIVIETEAPPALVLDSGASEPVARAVADLASRLGISEAQVRVVSIEAVEWPDSSLGCPQPGMDYLQVITPGFRILLEAQGERYPYHADQEANVVYCPAMTGGPGMEGTPPAMPRLPVGDDIKDGQPWMPVEPIPSPTP